MLRLVEDNSTSAPAPAAKFNWTPVYLAAGALGLLWLMTRPTRRQRLRIDPSSHWLARRRRWPR